MEERCAATRVRVLDGHVADAGQEPDLTELFRGYLTEVGTGAGRADHVLESFSELLAEASVVDLDRRSEPLPEEDFLVAIMANRPVEPRVRERLLVNRQPWAGVESGSVDAAAGSHNNSAGGPEGALIADGPTEPVPAGAMAIALAHTGPAHMGAAEAASTGSRKVPCSRKGRCLVRPLELSFANVRSYASFGLVVFDGRSLVGILGDTGAGKSTILEALCLALYGRCTWSDRDVQDLLTDGAPHMSVDLKFAHEGQSWRVRRTYYANTRPTMAALENLEPATRWITYERSIPKLCRCCEWTSQRLSRQCCCRKGNSQRCSMPLRQTGRSCSEASSARIWLRWCTTSPRLASRVLPILSTARNWPALSSCRNQPRLPRPRMPTQPGSRHKPRSSQSIWKGSATFSRRRASVLHVRPQRSRPH